MLLLILLVLILCSDLLSFPPKGTIDMDLITTGVSASERMRRENLVSTTRNIIMEKMQLGGPSMRLLEVLSSTTLCLKPPLHFSLV